MSLAELTTYLLCLLVPSAMGCVDFAVFLASSGRSDKFSQKEGFQWQECFVHSDNCGFWDITPSL